MLVAVLLVLPALVTASGEGNIHLLDDEVAVAMRACTTPSSGGKDAKVSARQQRSAYQYDSQYGDATPRIDGNAQQDVNMYSHERRNTSDVKEQMQVLNATDYDYDGYSAGEKLANTVPRPAGNRTRRSEPLFGKPDSDLCLSQCIFANLQVVDARGIPREAELWGRIQTSVTSQQSRAALHDQVRACFQELQSEAEDDGCSYSNKLERCLMLRFSDRKPAPSTSQDAQKNK
ncbi:uncharacterized protein LOC105392919 [Plutella xylostella]|uniref:uncharacterized protein LOC105392919 n=1 Tax=Plutella xylostella TaxID=51655 RepID=UPI002032FDAE|nr:uncharacterized protein LOC105392919 [Plutella xylostella]